MLDVCILSTWLEDLLARSAGKVVEEKTAIVIAVDFAQKSGVDDGNGAVMMVKVKLQRQFH